MPASLEQLTLAPLANPWRSSVGLWPTGRAMAETSDLGLAGGMQKQAQDSGSERRHG